MFFPFSVFPCLIRRKEKKRKEKKKKNIVITHQAERIILKRIRFSFLERENGL
jgi:hypothetical protein